MIDTDVIRSGLQSRTGASRLILCGVAEGVITPILTVATILEHEDVLMRPECLQATGLSAQETSAFLDGLLACSDLVVVQRRIRPSIRDPSDKIFVEALVNGAGEAIVTSNRRDYRSAEEGAGAVTTVVPVLAPGDVLRRLAWRPTATTPFVFPRR